MRECLAFISTLSGFNRRSKVVHGRNPNFSKCWYQRAFWSHVSADWQRKSFFESRPCVVVSVASFAKVCLSLRSVRKMCAAKHCSYFILVTKEFWKDEKAIGVGVPTCGHNVKSFWPLKAGRCRVGPKLLEKTATAGISSFSQNKLTSKAETENVVFCS